MIIIVVAMNRMKSYLKHKNVLGKLHKSDNNIEDTETLRVEPTNVERCDLIPSSLLLKDVQDHTKCGRMT